jgi:membrane protein YqaA with SNARE-associated domain
MIETKSVWEWLHRLGGPGLIALGLADNTPFVSAPPGSMDIVVILLSAHNREWWVYYAFMATVGEVLGGYLTYRLAEKSGQATFERKVGKTRAEKVYKQFEKRGAATLLSGAILPPPFPFTSVVMAAGVMHYPRKKFFLALTAGRAVRFVVVAYFGRIYGQKMIDFFARYYHPMMYALIAAAVAAGIGALVYFLHRRAVQHKVESKSGKSESNTPLSRQGPKTRKRRLNAKM